MGYYFLLLLNLTLINLMNKSNILLVLFTPVYDGRYMFYIRFIYKISSLYILKRLRFEGEVQSVCLDVKFNVVDAGASWQPRRVDSTGG